MKFATVLALAAGAMAFKNETVSYTTEVVTAVTTFCPGPTEVTYGQSTYTITEATTLTISDCPCTIKVPVTTISSVVCNNCPPVYHNSTSAPAVPTSHSTAIGTVTKPAPTVPTGTGSGTPPIETAGAGRAAVLSGGALAGVLGLAAFVL
ncbi:uncharacterized protein B0H64DRAFT_36626 [Chaetomium fimeti]|jgi:hypothetical protein|uniref:Clock-controlled protein 6 n=1 Tax=Chaetomium fimeti TaxID=1854472 RepID=A0AAE0HRT7_9PEZI|nr:hypothetical protein B0H64DRAFT_36626 [Chaetomium fimeti]